MCMEREKTPPTHIWNEGGVCVCWHARTAHQLAFAVRVGVCCTSLVDCQWHVGLILDEKAWQDLISSFLKFEADNTTMGVSTHVLVQCCSWSSFLESTKYFVSRRAHCMDKKQKWRIHRLMSTQTHTGYLSWPGGLLFSQSGDLQMTAHLSTHCRLVRTGAFFIRLVPQGSTQ